MTADGDGREEAREEGGTRSDSSERVLPGRPGPGTQQVLGKPLLSAGMGFNSGSATAALGLPAGTDPPAPQPVC